MGRHARPELTLAFPDAHQLVAYGTGHFDLLDKAECVIVIPSVKKAALGVGARWGAAVPHDEQLALWLRPIRVNRPRP